MPDTTEEEEGEGEEECPQQCSQQPPAHHKLKREKDTQMSLGDRKIIQRGEKKVGYIPNLGDLGR